MVSLTEAKRKFAELVDRAERGEKIGITRYGKLTAVIGPTDLETNLDKLFEGMEKIRRRAKPLCGATIKQLIQNGRL